MPFSRIKTPFGDFDQIVSVETLQAFAAQWAASIQNYLLDTAAQWAAWHDLYWTCSLVGTHHEKNDNCSLQNYMQFVVYIRLSAVFSMAYT